MEYASAVIGIVAFGLDVVHTVHRLLDALHDAPADLRALRDRAADVAFLLRTLERAHAAGHLAGLDADAGEVRRLEARVRAKMEGVRRFVEGVVRRGEGEDAEGRVRRVKWVWKRDKVEGLLEQLTDLKTTIAAFVAMANSHSTSSITNTLVAIRTTQDAFLQRQEELSTHAQTQQILELIAAQSKLFAEHLVLGRPADPSPDDQVSDDASTLMSSATAAARQGRTSYSNLRSSPCPDDCSCRCHDGSVTHFPPYSVSTVTGSWLIPQHLVRKSPSLFSRCDEPRCLRTKGRASPTRIKYFFPLWFQVIDLDLRLRFAKASLHFHIITPRVVDEHSPVFKCILDGDLDAVKMMLLHGEATVNDVTDSGWGLLHEATLFWFLKDAELGLEMISFLVQCGVDPNYVMPSGQTVIGHIIDLHCYHVRDHPGRKFAAWLRGSKLANEVIRPLFHQDALEALEDFCEMGSRNIAHREDLIVFGLADEPNDVDVSVLVRPIKWGPEPLETAASYVPEVIPQMLASGKYDVRRGTPLHQAIDANSRSAIVPLVDAGVDVNFRCLTWDGYAPIHMIAEVGDLEMLKVLAAAAGDRLDWALRTLDGRTALEIARESEDLIKLDRSTANEFLVALEFGTISAL